MTEGKTWKDEVEKVVVDRACALNYEEGVQCSFMPTKSEDGAHTLELLLEMTHSDHPFDLRWMVRFTDTPSDAIPTELIAPETEGGTLTKHRHDSTARLEAEGHKLAPFIRGYFVGRSSVSPAEVPQSE